MFWHLALTIMPYKRKGNIIYHKKGNKWTVKQKCRSVKNAKKAIRLLRGIKHGWKPGSKKR